MNKFNEYFTTPFGTVEVESDEEAILSIQILQSGKTPKEQCNPNLYTNLCIMQLKEYLAGDRRVFSFPYRQMGTDFQNNIWTEIAKSRMEIRFLIKNWPSVLVIRIVYGLLSMP